MTLERLLQWLRRPFDELSRWHDRSYLTRHFPHDASATRVYFEIQHLRRTGRVPSHWPIKVYAPMMYASHRIDWTLLGHAPSSTSPAFGQRLVHPQELMEISGRFPAYYAERFDRSMAKFYRPPEAPQPTGGFA